MSTSLVYDSKAKPLTLMDSFKVIWENKFLIWLLATHAIYSKYKRSFLGIVWSFLNPAITSAVIFIVFGKIFNGYLPDNRGYAGYVYSGILLQVLIIQGVSTAAQQIPLNSDLILKMKVNPIVFALSSGLAQVIHFCIGLVGLIPIFIFYRQDFSMKLFLILFYLIAATLAFAGLCMLLAGVFIRFDDSAYLLTAFMMIISYLTPILYPIDILDGMIKQLVLWNPITSWVSVFRWVVLENQDTTNYSFLVVSSTSILFFVFGILYINRKWNRLSMYL
jgi:ABC-type polysaccharide/polyol phosphate export permease